VFRNFPIAQLRPARPACCHSDAQVPGRRARVALAAADLDPATGRARLSYRRAEEIFNKMTKPLAHPTSPTPPSSPTHLAGRCTT
jgi:hypothetical protein